MSHFYGIVHGQAATPVTRRGSKKSGLVTTAASWQGAVEVELYAGEDGIDYARIRLHPWHGAGTTVEVFHGPVSGERD